MSATRNSTLNDPNPETLYDRRKRMLFSEAHRQARREIRNCGFLMH